ncbi:MAG: FAD/NAD(P)-binding oxidoreductase [Geobacteraceae bacterium]|nr:FAD/NAD(P)-binding oxidoreductase [Geobacteraceae bacterium]
MRNESPPKTALRIISLIQALTLLAFILVLAFGCRPDKPSPNPSALLLKTRIQANLDLFIPELTENLAKKRRKKVKTILDNFYARMNGPGDGSPFFLAILDKHGVTVTRRTQTSLSGSQNYGNYQVVLNVLQKKRTFTSSLYLQGGGKVYIICVPLLDSVKLTGVIIIGIDSEFLRQAGITESQFMSLDFNNQAYSTP